MNNEKLRKFLARCGKEGYAAIQDTDEIREDDQKAAIRGVDNIFSEDNISILPIL